MSKSLVLAVSLLALAVDGLTLGSEAGAESPEAWSLDRASVVITAQGASVDSKPYFLPAVGLSYSLTSAMSLIADSGYDFASDGSISRLGARFHVADFGQGEVGLGVSWVAYGGSFDHFEHDTSVEASVHGAWPVARRLNGSAILFLTGSASRDMENEFTTFRLGLRGQLFGGKRF